MIKIQKRDVIFYNRLKGRDSQTFHNKAITYRRNIQKNLTKLECYLSLNREYTVAEYLTTATDPK
jgi:hypothetical protein